MGEVGLHPLTRHSTLISLDRRLQENFKGEVVTHLQAKYPGLRDEKNLLAFKRKWEYMFVYAEVGYARAYTSLTCWTFARPVCPHAQFCMYQVLAEVPPCPFRKMC